MSTSRLQRALRACILSIIFIPVPVLATMITVVYGDIDGFGFTDVSALVDGSGAAADKNSNGILDEGDSLPSLGTLPGIGPGSDDHFDNRDTETVITPYVDPTITDNGFTANSVLPIDFSFTLPTGHFVTSATFSLLGGDFSFSNETAHTISVDGLPTGEFLNTGGIEFFDGRISLTEILINNASLLGAFSDGTASFGLNFSTAPDDIAIDYAQLTIVTAAVPEPGILALLGLSLAGLVVTRKRKR